MDSVLGATVAVLLLQVADGKSTCGCFAAHFALDIDIIEHILKNSLGLE